LCGRFWFNLIVELAWVDSFRTFEWEKACPAPELIINQVSQLLALV